MARLGEPNLSKSGECAKPDLHTPQLELEVWKPKCLGAVDYLDRVATHQDMRSSSCGSVYFVLSVDDNKWWRRHRLRVLIRLCTSIDFRFMLTFSNMLVSLACVQIFSSRFVYKFIYIKEDELKAKLRDSIPSILLLIEFLKIILYPRFLSGDNLEV